MSLEAVLSQLSTLLREHTTLKTSKFFDTQASAMSIMASGHSHLFVQQRLRSILSLIIDDVPSRFAQVVKNAFGEMTKLYQPSSTSAVLHTSTDDTRDRGRHILFEHKYEVDHHTTDTLHSQSSQSPACRRTQVAVQAITATFPTDPTCMMDTSDMEARSNSHHIFRNTLASATLPTDSSAQTATSDMELGPNVRYARRPGSNWLYNSFNINGLKHFVKDGHLRAHLTIHRPDVLCLQEIKTRRDKLDKMRSLHSMLPELGYAYCYYATCDRPRTGLHGTAILSKVKPERIIYGWAHTDRYEDEGRLITAIFCDHAIVNVYVPSSGLAAINLNKHLNFMNEFNKHFHHLQSSLHVPVFATGDFNAIMHTDDWFDLDSNPKRRQWPSCTNADQTALHTFLDKRGLDDAWSTMKPSSKDGYTYFEHKYNRQRNRGGRIDYLFATNKDLESSVRDVWLCRDSYGSDHIPLAFRLCTGEPDPEPEITNPHLASCMAAFSTLTPTTHRDNTPSSDTEQFHDPLPWDELMDDDSEVTQEERNRLEREAHERNSDAVRSAPSFNGSDSLANGVFADVSELRVSRIITASVPMSEIAVRLHKVQVLWDTGASFCCIGLKIVRILYGNNYSQYCIKGAKCPTFELADGSRSSALGCIAVPLTLRKDGVVTWQEFFILPTETISCILGVDFFCRFQALVDFGSPKQVTLPKLQNSIDFLFNIVEANTVRGSVSPLFAPHDMTLNPADELTFSACLAHTDPLSGLSPLIGRVTRAFKGVDPRHCCANVFTTLLHGKANVTIANISSFTSILRKGSVIGYFRHADVVKPDDPVLGTRVASSSEQYRLLRPILGKNTSSLSDCIPEEHRQQKKKHAYTEHVDPEDEEKHQHGPLGPNGYDAPVELPPPEPPPDEARDDFYPRMPLANASVLDTGDRISCKPCWFDDLLEKADNHKKRSKLKTSPIGEDGLPTDLDLSDAKANLTDEQYARLVALLARYSDCFAKVYGRPKKATGVQMTIDIPEGTPPVWRSTRRWNPKKKLLIIDFTKRLLEAGIIEPTDSDWNSNLFCVPKADGSPRLVQDLTGMNAVTKPIRSTLPMINECLEGMGGSRFFSVCDLDSAYHSLDLHPDSRKYTAFTTPIGRFQWTRAVMGARSSQEFLCRITQKMLAGSGLLWSRVAIYSDDICCYSPTFDEHLQDLEKLLSGVRSVNLTLSAKKCKFAAKKVSYCGFIVDEDGIHADPKSCEAIREMKVPTNLKTLRAFLGACSWWRRFIPHFAKIVEPLRPLMKKDGWATMNTAQLSAIQTLKDALCSTPILAHPNFDLPFELHCDGSPTGVGCALIQIDPVTGKRVAVSYFSKSLSPAQKKYAQFEIEALSVLTGLEVYRSYFAGENVKVFTDSLALKQLLDSPLSLKGRRCRWWLRISEFNYSIEHRKGTQHVVPDLLSRCHSGLRGPDPGFEVDPYETLSCKSLFVQPSRSDTLCRNQDRALAIIDKAQSGSSHCKAVKASLQEVCPCRNNHRPSCIHSNYCLSSGRVFCKAKSPHSRSNPPLLCRQLKRVKHGDGTPKRRLIRRSTPRVALQPQCMQLYVPPSPEVSALPLCSALPASVKIDISGSDTRQIFIREQALDSTCTDLRAKLNIPCGCPQLRTDLNEPLPAGCHVKCCIHAHNEFKDDLLYWLPKKRVVYHVDENGRVTQERTTALATSHSSPRVYVPESLQTSVLYHYHGLPLSGHVGRDKTISNISRKFYWKGMHDQAKRWIRSCIPCNRRKAAPKANADEPGVLKSRFPMDVICIDHVGPLFESKRGNVYILTAIDVFTRFPFAIPVQDRKAETVARALYENIFQLFSFPSALVSDNAPEFVGKVMTALCDLFHIKHIRTMPYTPMLNGCLERFHRYLNATLTMLTSRWKDNWDDKLPSAMLVYRSSTHATLRYSPFQVLFGRSPTLGMDIAFPPPTTPTDVPTYVRRLNDSLQEMYTEMREQQCRTQSANLARRETKFRERLLNKDDFVFVSASHNAEVLPSHLPRIQKLLDRNSGPFRITRVIGNGPRRKYEIYNDIAKKLQRYRPSRLIMYSPWLPDGTPSVPARPTFTTEERRTINSQQEKYLPPAIQKGSLVIFPRTMEDGSNGFGIGRAVARIDDERWDLQWYSNMEEDLYGTYKPCWTHPSKHFYCQMKPRVRYHKPMLTSETFPWDIRHCDCADVGFKLVQHRVPLSVLRRASTHKAFKWTAPSHVLNP